MTFPYHRSYDSGQALYVPQVDLILHGLQRSQTTRALVDSGADHNVFGIELAQLLDIPFDEHSPVHLFGIGNTPYTGFLVELDCQLGRHRWMAPTILSTIKHQKPILGRAGFFAYFRVCFDERKKQMQITRRQSYHQ